MHKSRSTRRGGMLLLLGLLLSGCGTVSKPLPPPVVRPAAIPPLPIQAKQPAPPEICLPTCSAGLTRLRERLQRLPMPHGQPAKPANEHMAR